MQTPLKFRFRECKIKLEINFRKDLLNGVIKCNSMASSRAKISQYNVLVTSWLSTKSRRKLSETVPGFQNIFNDIIGKGECKQTPNDSNIVAEISKKRV